MKSVFIVALALLLALPLTGLAQQVVTGRDQGCDEVNDTPCGSNAYCSSLTFTAEYTGTYLLDAWTECISPGAVGCACRSCVRIYGPDSAIPLAQQQSSCTYPCVSNRPVPVSLVRGNSYVLMTCLVPCPDHHCANNDCGDNCVAYGCARIGVNTPCWR